MLILLAWNHARLDDARCFTDRFFGGEAVNFIKSRVDILDDAVGVGDEHCVVSAVDAQFELLRFLKEARILKRGGDLLG